MHPIHAGQIKAARAMLDWSREDLAQATGLSLNTIRNLETGYISPRGSTTRVIRQAIENAGLEFIDREGVRRRTSDVRFFQGPASCDAFFDDLLQTVRHEGGDVLAVFGSPEMLLHSCGATARHPERLKQLNGLANIKCLVAEGSEPPLIGPSFQFRSVARRQASPIPYYVYGDRHAVVLPEGSTAFRFIVFQSASIAQSYYRHFLALWDEALPIPVQAESRPARYAKA
jgi:transcriptional regulator with XRE-family HTH domain